LKNQQFEEKFSKPNQQQQQSNQPASTSTPKKPQETSQPNWTVDPQMEQLWKPNLGNVNQEAKNSRPPVELQDPEVQKFIDAITSRSGSRAANGGRMEPTSKLAQYYIGPNTNFDPKPVVEKQQS